MSDNFWIRCLLMPLLFSSMLLMTGCGGCSNDDAKTVAEKKKEEEEKKRAENKKPKENFDTDLPVIYPGVFRERKPEDEEDSEELTAEEELKKERERDRRNQFRNFTKPGHWVNAYFPVIANNFDSNGWFSARGTDATGKPIPILGSEFFSYTERRARLAKGEWKELETTLFLPKRDEPFSSSSVRYSLSGDTGLEQVSLGFPHTLMHPGQFHIVVLSSQPDAYRYLNALDCVRMPEFTTLGSPMRGTAFYSVVIPRANDPAPLSRNSMTWTTIAYLVWGDYAPADLDPEQQQALVDWLHFGGQIILSGPDALGDLRNSFLSPYLPAEFVESTNLEDADFDELNENWSIPLRQGRRKKDLLRLGSDTVVGVKWKEHPEAKYLEGTSEMVLERQVGRGRIVVTRFSIDSKSPAVGWRSYSSFFNGCLLRKPSRNFDQSEWGDVTFRWDNDGASPYDPLLGSTLRFVSRDLQPLKTDEYTLPPIRNTSFRSGEIFGQQERVGPSEMSQVNAMTLMRNTEEDPWHYGGFKHDNQAGVAGWDDFSGISNAARTSLQSAAGIDPPSPTFVLRMLGVYLLILVPVNWLIFRAIGKVEWAWIAAPVIAIAGAFAVVKMAELDIGFARSQTQLGMLEMYDGYSRGHLTEYSALYTSLSTRYAMQMENSGALSLPFAKRDLKNLNSRNSKPIRGVRMNRSIDNRLEDFLIQSNSADMLHTEMMQDMGGAISMRPDRGELLNETRMSLLAVGIVGRDDDGNYQRVMIGNLDSGESAPLNFETVDRANLYSGWFANQEFNVSLGDAQEIWDSKFSGQEKISVNELTSVEGISARKILDCLADVDPEIDRLGKQRKLITKLDFEIAFEKVNALPAERLNLGGMLFTIDKTMTLGVGEYRMIGFTNDQLSRNVLSPNANQLQNKTMVLVHLQRPAIRNAQRDVDHWANFIVKSDLEFEEERERDRLQDSIDADDDTE